MTHAEHRGSDETDDLVQRGLRAWTNGDLDALEAVLDPDVTLGWIEPGEWDCVGRDQVMDLLRERASEGRTADPRRVGRIDAHTVVVSSDRPGPYGAAATRISIAHDKVMAMRQFATRDAALADDSAG
jgi:ketosteroid isomerase-like protein